MDNGLDHGAHDEITVLDPAASLDLDGIERDLADVEVALARLDAGTYWTDEISGDALPAEMLASRPTARRNPSTGATDAV
ncbi:MAG: hypothetical protein WCC60_14340 [Ilumatobacteraceae bacterium]